MFSNLKFFLDSNGFKYDSNLIPNLDWNLGSNHGFEPGFEPGMQTWVPNMGSTKIRTWFQPSYKFHVLFVVKQKKKGGVKGELHGAFKGSLRRAEGT